MASPTKTSPSVSDEAVSYRIRQLVLVYDGSRPTRRAISIEPQVALRIGRAPDGEHTFVLRDDEASRTHAEVIEASDGWFVEDLGSRNGVIVDGVKTPRAKLTHGSVVRIGRSILVCVDEELKKGQELRAESRALLGESFAMQRLRGAIALAALQAAPVLVLGPTGAGKERVAEALHAQSGRAGPFLPVNCAALPEALAESELFGHAPGAFTGATQRKEGLFAAAEGGTIFLDEVGELPAPVQAKLLRVLATGEVRAIGKTEAHRVDVRVVAATHRSVGEVLRGDLLARLSAWTIEVPPLRDRRDDVLRLAQAFLGGTRATLSPGAAEALVLFEWPFNVRQLEHAVAAASSRAKGAVIHLEHLPDEIARKVLARAPAQQASVQTAPPPELLVRRDETPSEEDLRLVLARFGGNLSKVAEFFGKDRRQIYRWLERYGIPRDS